MVHISEREIQLPDSVVTKLLCLVAESKDVISLSLGEPDFITPKPLLDYSKKVISNSTHYSPTAGYSELREAIVKKLRKENKINCGTENVIAGCGSQELFFAGFNTVLDVTEEVVLPSPCYLAYIPQIELVGGVPKLFELKEEDNWDVNPDELKKAIDRKKTKVILVNTPS